MTTTRRAALRSVLAVAWLVGSMPLLSGQQGAAVARPVLAPAEMEDFLLHARIDKTKGAAKGVTSTQRATLSDGRITHDASIQTIDVSMPVFQPANGPMETNFKDSYRYNIAGYRMARLLGLDNVPMSVERRVQGKPAAVTWWIDDVLMDEGERVKKPTTGGMSSRMAGQIHIMRVFDELIANTDRNGGNVLWTKDGEMWLIDHTRAFRLGNKLRTPRLLERCERGLFEKMRGLTAEILKREAGTSMNKDEISALLARRDELVKLFEAMIAQRGERSVLYTQAQL